MMTASTKIRVDLETVKERDWLYRVTAKASRWMIVTSFVLFGLSLLSFILESFLRAFLAIFLAIIFLAVGFILHWLKE